MAKDMVSGPVSKPEGGFYESSESIRAREAAMMEAPSVEPRLIELEEKLNGMNLKELRKAAKDAKLTGYSRMKKEKLIGVLLLEAGFNKPEMVLAPISPTGDVPVVTNPDAPDGQSARVKRIASS